MYILSFYSYLYSFYSHFSFDLSIVSLFKIFILVHEGNMTIVIFHFKLGLTNDNIDVV